MKDILHRLFEYRSLDKSTARDVLVKLAEGKYNQSEMAAFMAVYIMRSITVEELAGFREAMLDLCLAVDLKDYDPIDLCGTGGDGKDTFNISTLASFVVAGAGQQVAKHGNNGVSSVCGSSNVLQALGYDFTNNADELKRQLDRANICFLHAPLFHPAMKNVAPVRRELGVKTFFNMLGPMVNPAFPKKQMVGVFSLELLRLYSYLYQRSDADFMIVHSLDGYDEISLTGDFKAATRSGEYLYSPEDLNLKKLQAEQIAGGDTVEKSANLFKKIISGKGNEAQNNVVLANAAAALYTAGKGSTLATSLSLAEDSLYNGKAKKALEALTGKLIAS
ncbi:MAG: anthranilate phosphoribosyltransferase [Cyclobacteriaceae bacterium]|nr:anthranilate phosphoribosyltransferase [Cyclobacteriaceae bacterium]MCH8516967.1 anthranilate phosphoribosyltransferase [Cyclobacteriaceae bacterium]